jgi:predicted amidophosphoribosyltransferase
MQCLCCGTDTPNPKFCSRTCSARITNLVPKRKPKPRSCKHCGLPVTGRNTTCAACNRNYVDWDTITIGVLKERTSFQYSARIRAKARDTYSLP